MSDHAESFAHHLAVATDRGLIPDPGALRAIWDDALAAPAWSGPPVWVHGDLHPANVLTRDGNLTGVVDFGDLFAGDPAVDLSAAWILLPDDPSTGSGSADSGQTLEHFHQSYRPIHQPALDTATRRRTRGLAVTRALGCLLIGDAGVHGRPGGKATWGPPAQASLRRLITVRPPPGPKLPGHR
ncbi:hypothetical protein GCM10022223_13810 [Kineosporia mesophila]|uniref:Aminoglycoside phosphotransferase domain-containing protein n=1 Tax=Kineosporia mesophila TaxID=566012 RepID=A0ABP6Z6N8_9ACTN